MSYAGVPFGGGIFGAGIFGGGFESSEAPDNNYSIDLRVGSHVYTITSADELDPDPTEQVLDGMRVGWSFPDGGPWPAQPNPMVCRLGLLTNDVATFADLDIGTPLYVRMTDPITGDLMVSFPGRIGDLKAGPVKRGEDAATIVTLYELAGVDFTVDLAELPVTVLFPAQTSDARFTTLADLVRLTYGVTLTPPVGMPTVDLAELDVKGSNVLAVLDELARGIAEPAPWTRWIVVPVFGDDPLTEAPEPVAFTLAPHIPQVTEPGPLPLTLEPTGDALAAIDLEAVLPAGEVELATVWTKRKDRAVNVSTVAGAYGDISVANGAAGVTAVRQRVTTSLVSALDGRNAARMYLPDVDASTGWECEGFLWRIDPDHQAKLTPMVPDPFTLEAPECFRRPVVVAPIPNTHNPTGDAGYTAGQLGGLTLTLSKRRLVAVFQLRRRIAPTYDDATAAAPTWDAAKAAWPAVAWDDLDPTVMWYDTRLVRMAP